MYIPPDLKLTMAQRNINNAISYRENTTIFPVGSDRYDSPKTTQTGVIEFKFPNVSGGAAAGWDLGTLFLHWNFTYNANTADKTAGNVVKVMLDDSAESLIESAQVWIAGQIVEDIRNGYNVLETFLNACGVNDNFIKKYSAVMACGLSSTQRCQLYSNQSTTGTAITFRTVSHSIPLRLLGVAQPLLNLPGNIFGSQFLYIRLTMASVQSVTYARQEPLMTNASAGSVIAGGAPINLGTGTASDLNYTLTNIRATCDCIYYSQEYSNMLNQLVQTQKLTFPIKTWDLQSFTINSGQSRVTQSLSFPYSSCDSLCLFFFRSSEFNNFAYASTDRLVYPSNLSTVSIRIGGKLYPAGNPINCANGASEAFVHLQSALNNLTSPETIGSLSYYTNPINVTYGGAAYISGTYSIPTFGDIYYGRNRPETIGTIYSAVNDTNFNNCFNILATTALVVPTATSGFISPYTAEMAPSSFGIGVNLKSIRQEEPGITSGLDIAQSGGLVSIEMNWSGGTSEGIICFVALQHNRFINVMGSSVDVSF